jgi:hypothetical protein
VQASSLHFVDVGKVLRDIEAGWGIAVFGICR